MANEISQKIYREKRTEWDEMECTAYGSMLFWINHIEIKVNEKNYCLCELYEFIELILSHQFRTFIVLVAAAVVVTAAIMSAHTLIYISPLRATHFFRLAFFAACATHFKLTKFGSSKKGILCSMPSCTFFFVFFCIKPRCCYCCWFFLTTPC